MPKKTFAERRKMVIDRRRAKAAKEHRKGPTALQRYEEQGIHFHRTPQQFAWPSNYDDLFPLSADERKRQLEVFASDRGEKFDQVVRMVGNLAMTVGLTFDELLFQHEWSGWAGPQTISERQRNAAYKAWDTMRARKAAQQNE